MAYFEQVKLTDTGGSPINAATETTLGSVDGKLTTINNNLTTVNTNLNDVKLAVTVGELVEAIEALRMSVNSLTRSAGLMTFTSNASVRMNVDSIGGSVSLPNLSQFGGYSINSLVQDFGHFSADNLRRNILVT